MSNPNAASESLDISHLPVYEKRRFVPDGANLADSATVVSLFKRLSQSTISSVHDLEEWLKDRSELDAALDQAGSLLYIRMTCQTDDEARANAYKNFIEHVVPAVKPLSDELNHKYLDFLKKFPLNENYYGLYNRGIRSDIELFQEKNVPLQTEVELLSQEYQTICGAMTVNFKDKEYTLPQMSKFLLENDRALRESAWRAISDRRLKEKDRLDELFSKMLKLRHKIALNAGFKNFVEYQFKAFHRFDYSPNECRQYHSTIERFVVPLIEKILQTRTKQMQIAQLRPWDLAVDPLGLPPLKPFLQIEELIDGVEKIFNKMSPQFGQEFKEMMDLGLLDLANRKGKAPGGYQNTLAEARKPFIFMNAVGVDSDVWTLLHEGGHAFHALAAAGQFLYSYRHAPMEFCEVASMGMELMARDQIDVFYKPEEALRSKLAHLEDVVEVLAWVATIDSFQFWIYEHPEHTVQERSAAWLEIRRRFSLDMVDWSGLEEAHRFMWHRQLHIFEVPFYYIEYGIAQIGALQLWLKAKTDLPGAIASYRKALTLGGARPLPELFQNAGIKFDFSESTIRPLMKAVSEELEKI